MKTKIIILVAVSAVVTLSFTFASTNRTTASQKPSNISNKAAEEAPMGGFVIEDKL
jgi:hypothetical protein